VAPLFNIFNRNLSSLRLEGLQCIARCGRIDSKHHTSLAMWLTIPWLSTIEPLGLVIVDVNGEELSTGGILLVGAEARVDTSVRDTGSVEGRFSDSVVCSEDIESDDISNIGLDVFRVILEDRYIAQKASDFDGVGYSRAVSVRGCRRGGPTDGDSGSELLERFEGVTGLGGIDSENHAGLTMGLSVTRLSAVEPSWLVIGDSNGEGHQSWGVLHVGAESGINTTIFRYARSIEGGLGDGMVIGKNVEQDNISNLDIGNILRVVLENWRSSIKTANLDGVGRSSTTVTTSWARSSTTPF